MAANPPPGPRLNVELPATLEIVYANFAIINHSPSEVILDLGQLMPNVPQVKIRARVVLTPLNAKLFYHALGENLARYERRFGEVKMPQDFDPKQGFLGGVQWKVGGETEEPPGG